VRTSFQTLFADFREMKHYFIACTLVFAAGIYLGYSSEQFHAFLHGQVQGLGAIAQRLQATEHPQLWFFVFIFLNNAIKSILFIYLGAFFGVFPLFVLLVNGMILGFVGSAVPENESLLLMTITGILPHGIIELPAIIIACAYGIRFGVLVMKGSVSALRPSMRAQAGGQITRFLQLSLPLTLFLVVALFVAAIIESTLTYSLVK
jgi:stage II sporulation protein M